MVKVVIKSKVVRYLGSEVEVRGMSLKLMIRPLKSGFRMAGQSLRELIQRPPLMIPLRAHSRNLRKTARTLR